MVAVMARERGDRRKGRGVREEMSNGLLPSERASGDVVKLG